jgi:hypothetical protein
MVAAVQRRLGQLGYYRGVIDGVIGPQTRGAIAAFEAEMAWRWTERLADRCSTRWA